MKTESVRSIVEVINFLDKIRWSNQYNYLYEWKEIVDSYYNKNVDISKRMLIHWLAYLANKMVNADIVWREFVPKNAMLIDDYKLCTSSTDVDVLVEKYSSAIAKGLAKGDNLERIRQSLRTLLGFQHDLLRFLEGKVTEWNAKHSNEKVVNYLTESFYDLCGQKAIKRTSCVMRDFKKWSAFEDLPEALSPQTRKIWSEEFREEDLEIPPDTQVRRALVNLGFLDENVKNLSRVPSILRERLAAHDYYYPERFDVLWQVGRDFCSRSKCSQCLFGGGEVIDACQGSGSCSVVKRSFGWSHICENGACPLADAVGSCVVCQRYN